MAPGGATGGFERYFRYDSSDTAMEALEAARLLPPGYRTVLADAVRVFGLPYPTDVDTREEILDAVLAATRSASTRSTRRWRLERTSPATGSSTRGSGHIGAFFDG